MVDVTLFEIHLEDASFTANAPLGDEPESAGEGTTEGSGGPGRPLLALLVLALVIVLVWRLRDRGGQFEEDEGLPLIGA